MACSRPPAGAVASTDAPAAAPGSVKRVVSFLPSATEILCYIGGEALLVGRSHECDYPPSIRDRPALTAAVNAFESSRQMHDVVSQTLEKGDGLYTIDAAALEAAQPQVRYSAACLLDAVRR